MNSNGQRFAKRLKGSKGMRCINQKQPTVVTPNKMDNAQSDLSSGISSRSRRHNVSTTPAEPKPSRAVEIMRKPKWYQSATESTRVNDNSSSKVADESRKIPA